MNHDELYFIKKKCVNKIEMNREIPDGKKIIATWYYNSIVYIYNYDYKK